MKGERWRERDSVKFILREIEREWGVFFEERDGLER
jgi:hypothetical protein